MILHDAGLGFGSEAGTRSMQKWLNVYRVGLRMLSSPGSERQRVFRTAQLLRSVNLRIAQKVYAAAASECLETEPAPRACLSTAEDSASPSGAFPLNTIRGDPTEEIDLAHALLALHYTPFILYVVRQIQNLTWYLPAGFVLLTFSLTSYSLQAPLFIGRFLFVLFVLIGLVMYRCLFGSSADMILSRIAGTKIGELNKEFIFKFLGYGALPAFEPSRFAVSVDLEFPVLLGRTGRQGAQLTCRAASEHIMQ